MSGQIYFRVKSRQIKKLCYNQLTYMPPKKRSGRRSVNKPILLKPVKPILPPVPKANFPSEVVAEAEQWSKKSKDIWVSEGKIRRDFRPILTLTIDPLRAQDFDDAISFQILANGHYEIGVHIADVSFYVRENTALDKEAAHRGTSVYIVGKTIPMLPEVLSNNLCSLMPDQDRLSFSAVFEMDDQAKIHHEWFGRGIIRSKRRFTYEEVERILESGTGDYAQELKTIDKLAIKLDAQKIADGALTFSDREVEFTLDETGKPINVAKKQFTRSHKLVEDFMLLANRRVAEFASKFNKNQPGHFVYRIHDEPDSEKILSLIDFLKPLGYELKLENKKVTTVGLKKLLASAQNTPEENIISRATIQTMAKAIYSLDNIGHYGLAFPHYTHFTSPIRRYPDLLVHRLLALYLDGKHPSAEELEHYGQQVIHSTTMERVAMEAERSSIKLKQAEFFTSKIGEIRMGIISGVTDFGLFIEDVETCAEGLVHISKIGNERFDFQAKAFSLVGQTTKTRFRLGDKVTVKVKKTIPERGLIDWEIVKI